MKCPICHGTKKFRNPMLEGTHRCPNCNGTGEVPNVNSEVA